MIQRLYEAILERRVKRRSMGSYSLYVAARRLVTAYENSDVNISTNGEAWLQNAIATREPMTVFDVGANIGEWTQTMLAACRDCRVVCYEPVPATYALLRSAVNDPRTTLVDSALSDVPGTLTIHSVPDRPELSSVHSNHKETNNVKTLTLKATTGDAEMHRLGLEHISLLKIDCEGHDLAVLRGFQAALERERIDVIQFEYNFATLEANCSLKDFFTLLEKSYVICRLLPTGLEVCSYHPILDNFSQSNWVAVRLTALDPELFQRLAMRPAKGIVGSVLRRRLANYPERARKLGLAGNLKSSTKWQRLVAK